MIEDWVRQNPRVFTLQVHDRHQDARLQLHATIKNKVWSLFIGHEFIADFQTFEELDGMVPVLVNGYLNRRHE